MKLEINKSHSVTVSQRCRLTPRAKIHTNRDCTLVELCVPLHPHKLSCRI